MVEGGSSELGGRIIDCEHESGSSDFGGRVIDCERESGSSEFGGRVVEDGRELGGLRLLVPCTLLGGVLALVLDAENEGTKFETCAESEAGGRVIEPLT